MLHPYEMAGVDVLSRLVAEMLECLQRPLPPVESGVVAPEKS